MARQCGATRPFCFLCNSANIHSLVHSFFHHPLFTHTHKSFQKGYFIYSQTSIFSLHIENLNMYVCLLLLTVHIVVEERARMPFPLSSYLIYVCIWMLGGKEDSKAAPFWSPLFLWKVVEDKCLVGYVCMLCGYEIHITYIDSFKKIAKQKKNKIVKIFDVSIWNPFSNKGQQKYIYNFISL